MPSRNDLDRSLSDIASILWRRAPWLALATVGGALVAAIASAVMQPVYRVDLSVIAASADVPQHDLARIVGTWVYVLGDPAIKDQAATRLADRYEADGLNSVLVSVSPIDNSMVVAASVRAGSPELAVDFAQALFDVASASEVARPFPVIKLSSPQAPDAPESPKRRRNLLLGAAIGFLLGAALAFLFADLERSGWQLAQIFRSAP